MAELKERNGKIPILIHGFSDFAIIGGLEDFTFATLREGGYAGTLEEGIREVMRQLIRNARNLLDFKKKSEAYGSSEKYQKDLVLARRILEYNGKIEDHFYLLYYGGHRSHIEPRLGEFIRLERVVL